MSQRNTSRRAGEQTEQNGTGDPERAAQAAFEGVAGAPVIEFGGQQFRIAERVSYLPMLKFAHYASKGTDSASMQGMAAMYEMLRACFDRGRPCGECDVCTGDDQTPPNPRGCETRKGDEWPRFEDLAIEIGADDEQLFSVVTAVIEVVTARPTPQRSGYLPPAPPTSANSKGRSPDQADGLVSVDDLAR